MLHNYANNYYTYVMYTYTPNGTCSTKISFKVIDGKLYSVKFDDGCDGNLKAIGRLVEGTDAKETAQKLKGVICGDRGTSCADQLATAIFQHV